MPNTALAPAPIELSPLDALYKIVAPPQTPAGDRYFAIVLRVDPNVRVGNLLVASTHIGNLVRNLLPPGVEAIRSIELTENTAVNGIRVGDIWGME